MANVPDPLSSNHGVLKGSLIGSLIGDEFLLRSRSIHGRNRSHRSRHTGYRTPHPTHHMGLFPSFSSVVSQAVLIGALIGVSKRAGLITVHPHALKNETARGFFTSFVNSSEWAVAYCEGILQNAVGKK